MCEVRKNNESKQFNESIINCLSLNNDHAFVGMQIKFYPDDIKTVIEPYCGSNILSRNLILYNCKYILNNPAQHLIELRDMTTNRLKMKRYSDKMNIITQSLVKMKTDEERIAYCNELINQTSNVMLENNECGALISWYVKNTFFYNGSFTKDCNKINDYVEEYMMEMLAFFHNKDVTFIYNDPIAVYKQYKGNCNSIIILNPQLQKDIYNYTKDNCIHQEKAVIFLKLSGVWHIDLHLKDIDHFIVDELNEDGYKADNSTPIKVIYNHKRKQPTKL